MPISRVASPMVGTQVGINIEFFDEAREPADPTEVTVTAKPPGDDPLEIAVTQQGVGIYRSEFVVTVAGLWVVQASGTGDLTVVEETTFTVRPTVV